jgi:hypothetical protein
VAIPDAQDRALSSFARAVTRPVKLGIPGTVKLLGFSMDTGGAAKFSGAVITEYAANGPLGAVLARLWHGQAVPGFGPTEMSKCIFGIAFTMMQLHGMGKIHPHLTHNAVFLDADFEPLIGDLGDLIFGSPRHTKSQICTTPVETSDAPVFIAPEIHEDGPGAAANVFSYGMILYMFFAQLPPLTGSQRKVAIDSHYKDSKRWNRPPGISNILWDLVQACWDQAPTTRPGFELIVNRLNEMDEWILPGADVTRVHEYKQRRQQQENTHQTRPKGELREALFTVIGMDPLPRDLDE